MSGLPDAQHKLSALLSKSMELLPFATDEDCEEAFFGLAKFATKLLHTEKKSNEDRKRFASMDLEGLLKSTFVDEAVVPALALVTLRKDDSIAISIPFQHSHSSQSPLLYWDFQLNPNVVDILRVDHSPLNLFFTSRPALMGNHVPLTMYADVSKLLQLGKDDGTKQRATAIRRLKKAIVKFSQASALSPLCREPLFELSWASKSFKSKLIFEDNGASL